MTSKPILCYWDFRALGEPIRLLLRYLGVDFEDRRIHLGENGPGLLENWFKQKYSHDLDFPNLPFYKDEDVKITQSLAIMQHIGRKYNLCGDTLKEQAIIDMVVQTVNDLRWAVWCVYNAPDYYKIRKTWMKGIPGRLSEMNKFLEGKDFVLGKKISYADFFLYESMEWYRQFAMDMFEKDPGLQNLNEFQKRIESLPQIKKYMESEDFKAWPIYAPIVNVGYSKDPDFQSIPFPIRNFISKYPLEPSSEIVKDICTTQ